MSLAVVPNRCEDCGRSLVELQWDTATGDLICRDCFSRRPDGLRVEPPKFATLPSPPNNQDEDKDQDEDQTSLSERRLGPGPGCSPSLDDDGPEIYRLEKAYELGQLESVDV